MRALDSAHKVRARVGLTGDDSSRKFCITQGKKLMYYLLFQETKSAVLLFLTGKNILQLKRIDEQLLLRIFCYCHFGKRLKERDILQLISFGSLK